MFHAFFVPDDNRDYLRLLWYKNNNLNNNITEHRMKVHIFGNSPYHQLPFMVQEELHKNIRMNMAQTVRSLS